MTRIRLHLFMSLLPLSVFVKPSLYNLFIFAQCSPSLDQLLHLRHSVIDRIAVLYDS